MPKDFRLSHPYQRPLRALMPFLMAIFAVLFGLGSASAQGGPELDISNQVEASPNGQVSLPVVFTPNGSNISAMSFSVDFDETWLTFDATDGNGDGVPDAIALNAPSGFQGSVTYDPNDTDGELDFFIADLFPPLAAVPDGQIATITFNVGNPSSTTEAGVNFSSAPSASFGDAGGVDVPGSADNGSVLINVSAPPTVTPTPTTTPPVSSTHQLIITNSNTLDIYPGDTLPVEIVAEGPDMYGIQANCAVDSNVVAPLRATFGEYFTSQPVLIGANQVISETWQGGLSLRKPAQPLSGTGSFATVTYEAQTPGLATVTCVPLFSDENGFEQASTGTSELITVLPFNRINSLATYQGRLTHGNIQVSMSGPVIPEIVITNSNGEFLLNSLRNGDYNIEADAPRYLPNCIDQDVAGGVDITLDSTELRGGDVNDDGKINIGDATLVAANFGLAPSADDRADINADTGVNIQDLSILGSNYGLEGCQPWS